MTDVTMAAEGQKDTDENSLRELGGPLKTFRVLTRRVGATYWIGPRGGVHSVGESPYEIDRS